MNPYQMSASSQTLSVMAANPLWMSYSVPMDRFSICLWVFDCAYLFLPKPVNLVAGMPAQTCRLLEQDWCKSTLQVPQ